MFEEDTQTIRAPQKGIVDDFPLRITGMCTVAARFGPEDRSMYTVLGLGGRDTGQRSFVNEVSLVVAKQPIPRSGQA